MRHLLRPVLIVIAAFFLFEAWLWNRLAPIVALVVAAIPLDQLKAWIAHAIARLPPVATLAVFVVPFVLLLPLKFFEVWFLAHQNWLGAIATLVVAKLLGLGVTAFIFEVTRPKLLQLAWFRWLDKHVLAWLAWAHDLIDPVKRRLQIWVRIFTPQRAGRALRLFRRLRRRMYAQAAP